MNIFLIGYRGVGKSSVAPLLAEILGPPWDWVDLDSLIEAKARRPISQIFAESGESAFRDLETQGLAESAERDHLILATGGGAPMRPENQAILQQGYVVWLTAEIDTLLRRLTHDPTTGQRRPQLTSLPLRTEIETLLNWRSPVYQRTAHQTLSTENQAPRELAEAIAKAFQARLATGVAPA